MIFIEFTKPLFKHCIMMRLYVRRAGSYTLSRSSCGSKVDAAYAIIEQFPEQFATVHILISYGKEKTIAHRLIDILVVHYAEAITQQYLLYPRCAAALNIAARAHCAECETPEEKL